MKSKLRKGGKANHLAVFATHRADNVLLGDMLVQFGLSWKVHGLRFAHITTNVSILAVLNQGFVVEVITILGVVAESAQWMSNLRIAKHRASALVAIATGSTQLSVARVEDHFD